jgi:predicted alpha/beta superfamily hydrolase
MIGRMAIEFPPVQTHLIESKHVDQTFRIQVMQPGREAGDDTPLPVVYVTDGNWTFDLFKGLSYLLQVSEHDAPPFILVGIGYPSDAPHAGMILRIRDFTAPPYPEWKIESLRSHFGKMGLTHTLHEGTLWPNEGAPWFHGGEGFRTFIADEAIPLVESTYAADPARRTYFGHSGGGFFGLYTLFSQPELFANYLVSSPGLVYHGEMPGLHLENDTFGLRMAEDFIASGRSLEGKRLYLSAGGEEEFEPALGGWQIVSGLVRMSKILRSAQLPGLEVLTEVIPGETHMTVWPISFMHGVQAMLGTRKVVDVVY